jgi:hypothetical protein
MTTTLVDIQLFLDISVFCFIILNMFNLFPSFQKPEWVTATGYTIEGKYYTPAELMNEFIKLKNQLKSIEEDGTKEHNTAVVLRQENAQLETEIANLKVCSVKWRELYDEKADTVDELMKENTELKNGNKNWMSLYQEVVDKNNELLKEVNGLRHLKKENIELMERVNEIDSDVNRDLQDQLSTIKNDYAVLKAKYQILDHNYQGCTKYRDEYKHQLNAANKENEKLKKDIIDYVYEKDEQKHPMYPLHWGGYEPEKWSTTKVAVDDAVQAKQREVYGIEEKKTFKPWVEEPINWKKKTTAENLEERVAKLEEQLKYTQKIVCPE